MTVGKASEMWMKSVMQPRYRPVPRVCPGGVALADSSSRRHSGVGNRSGGLLPRSHEKGEQHRYDDERGVGHRVASATDRSCTYEVLDGSDTSSLVPLVDQEAPGKSIWP